MVGQEPQVPAPSLPFSTRGRTWAFGHTLSVRILAGSWVELRGFIRVGAGTVTALFSLASVFWDGRPQRSGRSEGLDDAGAPREQEPWC